MCSARYLPRSPALSASSVPASQVSSEVDVRPTSTSSPSFHPLVKEGACPSDSRGQPPRPPSPSDTGSELQEPQASSMAQQQLRVSWATVTGRSPPAQTSEGAQASEAAQFSEGARCPPTRTSPSQVESELTRARSSRPRAIPRARRQPITGNHLELRHHLRSSVNQDAGLNHPEYSPPH